MSKHNLSKLSSKYAKFKHQQQSRKMVSKNTPQKLHSTTNVQSNSSRIGQIEDDDEEDEDDDPLTIIIRQQRKTFSARVAAGRPSARNSLEIQRQKLNSKSDYQLPASTRLPSKVLRAWKLMAKKVICKVARQRLGYKRDKIALAKRAARDCARHLRQRALLSQRLAKDAISESIFFELIQSNDTMNHETSLNLL